MRDIHASLASEGQSVPPLGDTVDQAYTCFIVAPSPPGLVDEAATSSTRQRVVELDGTRAGPVDRGVCTDLVEVRLLFHFLVITLISYNAGCSPNSQRGFYQEQP